MSVRVGRKHRNTEIVYCARCGEADTRLCAVLRKLHTGYSACCNENLLERRPSSRPLKPEVYKGDMKHGTPVKSYASTSKAAL